VRSAIHFGDIQSKFGAFHGDCVRPVRICVNRFHLLADVQVPQLPQFVFWYHNERMINYDPLDGNRIEVRTETGPDGDQVISHLTIREASDVDSGNYTCLPSNAPSTSTLVFVSEGNQHFYSLPLPFTHFLFFVPPFYSTPIDFWRCECSKTADLIRNRMPFYGVVTQRAYLTSALTVRLCVDVRDFVDRRRRRLFGWWPLIDAARLLCSCDLLKEIPAGRTDTAQPHNGRFASIADVTAAALN
jgi:hypothetical protein